MRRPGRTSQRGAAMVELALVVLPMLALSLAAIDLARAVHAYDVLVRATRDATRMMAMVDPASPGLYAPVEARAVARAVTGTDDASAPPLLPGLAPSMVVVCNRLATTAAPCSGTWSDVPTGGSGTVDLVSVRVVGYTFRPWFPGTGLLPAGWTTFGTVGATMKQQP